MILLLTIDTEGDNLWEMSDVRQRVTTENARYLVRFQEMCEQYGFVPTYLTNYEMANSKAMVELGREGIKKSALEIGAHEHAWNTPPYYPLFKRWGRNGKPYLSEYPLKVIRNKLEYLTSTLEDRFQISITSHRGGRWCLNKRIVHELDRLGYTADCTCTPGVDWSLNRGWTIGSKGTNWAGYANRPFRLVGEGANKDYTSSLVEIPVSIADQRCTGRLSWLRPGLKNNFEMKSLLCYLKNEGLDYAEFMIHSSELMPGGSPYFPRKGQIEELYRNLDDFFAFAKHEGYIGMALSDYARSISNDAL